MLSATKTPRVGRRPTGKVTVQVRLPEAIRDELEQWAAKDNESLSQCIEKAMIRYFRARRAKEDSQQLRKDGNG